MPIYGYACTNCGHALDALQKIADDPLSICPACEQPELKRQLSAPRFRLKGQGWYETDFKKDNQRNIAGEKEAAKGDDKKADDKKTDGAAEKNKETKTETKLEKKVTPSASTSKQDAS